MVEVNTEYVIRVDEEEAKFIMTLLYCHVIGTGKNRAISDSICEAFLHSGLTASDGFPSMDNVNVSEK